jgi:preprotein translocase subunit SecF
VNFREAVATFRGHREPRFRLIEHRRWWFVLSGLAIALSLAGLVVRDLNLSIDFEGGSQLSYTNTTGVSADAVRELLESDPWNLHGAEVQILGGNQISVRAPSLTTLSDSERTELIDTLATQAGVSPDDVSRTDVGPTWGSQISRKALQGLIIVLVAIALYIALWSKEWKMAAAALVALAHDVIITAGVYALTGREVTPATVIAILTIMGFSLYDTVVIFDKIKENTESPVLLAKDTYGGVVNTSLNQVFMRSVNTSLVVVFPIASLLLFGGDTLKDFAFAMLIGVMTGAYSSIFVAAPIFTVLKEREPKYAQLRARAGREAGRRLRPVPDRPAIEEGVAAAAVPSSVGAAAATRGTARAGQVSRPRSRRKPPSKRKRR